MKYKTMAFIAAAALTGTLFGETTVEGIGVTADGFIFKKACLGDSASGGLGQFPDGFAIQSIEDVTNAVEKGYVIYDFNQPITTRVVAGYNAAKTGRFNFDGFDSATYQLDPLAPACGYPQGRWEHSSAPYYHATGTIVVPAAGKWTFNVGGNEGSLVRFEIGAVDFSAERRYEGGSEDMICVVDFPAAGEYAVEIWQYCNIGDIYLEFSAAKGEYESFDASAFSIVGDALTSYDVTFNVAGGSFVNPQTVKAGRAAKQPDDPFLDGYAFIGWTLNGEPYDFSQPVTSDMTLLATWTDNVSPEIVSVSSSPTKPVIDGTSVEVALNVSAYDADNDALTYAWSLVGEAPAAYSIANADSPSATATINGPGTFTFKVAVSDGTATVEETIEVVVGISPNATAFSYAGCEYAGQPIEVKNMEVIDGEEYELIARQGTWPNTDVAAFPWGASYHDGFKAAWRSTNAGNNNESATVLGRKDMLLDAKRPNAYGLDGYIFPGGCGNCDGEYPIAGDKPNYYYKNEDYTGTITPNVTSGVAYEGGLVVSNVTDYIRSIEFVNGNIGQRPGIYWIDDPREEISADVNDFRPGDFSVQNVNMDSFTTFLRIRFNGHVRNHPTVRIGFLSGYGDNMKPKYISVGGVSHAWEGNGEGYGHLTWMFFDIQNAKSGDVVECAIMGQNAWNACRIEGIVIDSIEKNSGFAIRIR